LSIIILLLNQIGPVRKKCQLKFRSFSITFSHDNNTSFQKARTNYISVLPPCTKCHAEHIKRTNYQVGAKKRSHISTPLVKPRSCQWPWMTVCGRYPKILVAW